MPSESKQKDVDEKHKHQKDREKKAHHHHHHHHVHVHGHHHERKDEVTEAHHIDRGENDAANAEANLDDVLAQQAVPANKEAMGELRQSVTALRLFQMLVSLFGGLAFATTQYSSLKPGKYDQLDGNFVYAIKFYEMPEMQFAFDVMVLVFIIATLTYTQGFLRCFYLCAPANNNTEETPRAGESIDELLQSVRIVLDLVLAMLCWAAGFAVIARCNRTLTVPIFPVPSSPPFTYPSKTVCDNPDSAKLGPGLCMFTAILLMISCYVEFGRYRQFQLQAWEKQMMDVLPEEEELEEVFLKSQALGHGAVAYEDNWAIPTQGLFQAPSWLDKILSVVFRVSQACFSVLIISGASQNVTIDNRGVYIQSAAADNTTSTITILSPFLPGLTSNFTEYSFHNIPGETKAMQTLVGLACCTLIYSLAVLLLKVHNKIATPGRDGVLETEDITRPLRCCIDVLLFIVSCVTAGEGSDLCLRNRSRILDFDMQVRTLRVELCNESNDYQLAVGCTVILSFLFLLTAGQEWSRWLKLLTRQFYKRTERTRLQRKHIITASVSHRLDALNADSPAVSSPRSMGTSASMAGLGRSLRELNSGKVPEVPGLSQQHTTQLVKSERWVRLASLAQMLFGLGAAAALAGTSTDYYHPWLRRRVDVHFYESLELQFAFAVAICVFVVTTGNHIVRTVWLFSSAKQQDGDSDHYMTLDRTLAPFEMFFSFVLAWLVTAACAAATAACVNPRVPGGDSLCEAENANGLFAALICLYLLLLMSIPVAVGATRHWLHYVASKDVEVFKSALTMFTSKLSRMNIIVDNEVAEEADMEDVARIDEEPASEADDVTAQFPDNDEEA